MDIICWGSVGIGSTTAPKKEKKTTKNKGSNESHRHRQSVCSFVSNFLYFSCFAPFSVFKSDNLNVVEKENRSAMPAHFLPEELCSFFRAIFLFCEYGWIRVRMGMAANGANGGNGANATHSDITQMKLRRTCKRY